jgi:hypothetical protein
LAFLYTDEQQAIGSEARRRLSARFNADALRTIVEQREGHDIDYWRLCRECGWTGVTIDPRSACDVGGLDRICVGAARLKTDDLEAYRISVREFLVRQVAHYGRQARLGLSEAEDLALGRRWQRLKHDNGFAGINWPSRYGGAGRSLIHKIIFDQEEMLSGFPVEYFQVSLGMPRCQSFCGARRRSNANGLRYPRCEESRSGVSYFPSRRADPILQDCERALNGNPQVVIGS